MKKVIYIFILIFVAFITFLPPLESYAQFDYEPSKIDVQYKYPWAGATSPADFVSRFYRIALGVVGGAALGVLVYGAVLWTVSGAISTKQDAMEWIWAAIWGLILLLGAYLILNTINPDLVKLKNPDQLLVPGTTSVVPPTQTAGGSIVPPAYAAGELSEEQSRQILATAGIGVKGVCPVGQSTECVDLNGIKSQTLNEVLSLASSVGSNNVFVSAGTEGCGTTTHAAGAYSHCNGYKADLRLNANLNNYITQNFQKISNRTSDGAQQYVSPSGVIYALEPNAKLGPHWDVLVI